MTIVMPDQYLDEAYRIACEYAQHNPLLKVWRCKVPDKHQPAVTNDSVVVGMLDESAPDVPSDLIVLTTHLTSARTAHIEVIDGPVSMTPFGGGWDPIEEFTEQAKKLATM